MTYNSYLDAYHNYFERQILEATTRYYPNESAQYRSNVTLVEYVNKLEARVEEEKRRTELYLLGSRLESNRYRDFWISEYSVPHIRKFLILSFRVRARVQSLLVFYLSEYGRYVHVQCQISLLLNLLYL